MSSFLESREKTIVDHRGSSADLDSGFLTYFEEVGQNASASEPALTIHTYGRELEENRIVEDGRVRSIRSRYTKCAPELRMRPRGAGFMKAHLQICGLSNLFMNIGPMSIVDDEGAREARRAPSVFLNTQASKR